MKKIKLHLRKSQIIKKKFLFELIANIKGKVMAFKGSNEFDALNEENLNVISNLFIFGDNKK